MPGSPEARINPELLEWAREEAGYTAAEAALALGLKEALLLSWESGEKTLTIGRLRKLSKLYRRAMSAFFLPTAPERSRPPRDFRRPGAGASPLSPAALLAIRRARAQRLAAIELYRAIGQEPPSFTVSLSPPSRSEWDGAATELSSALGLSGPARARWADHNAALRAWREAAEQLGCMVMQVGGLPPESYSGFAIGEGVLPVVALNKDDPPARRTFTLIHELVHLALGHGGVCAPFRIGLSGDETEVLCNHIAGAVLVPRETLLTHALVQEHRRSTEWDQAQLRALADDFRVSRDVIARRLHLVGRASREWYTRIHAELSGAPQRKDPGGKAPVIPLPIRSRSRLGARFLELTAQAYEAGAISALDASDFLGCSLKTLSDVVDFAVTGQLKRRPRTMANG